MTKGGIFKKIIIGLLISAVVILFPLLFICNAKDAIELGATILGGLSGVGAIIIGLSVYDDIIGKKILEKGFDTVNSFLEEIKGLLLKVAFYTGNELKMFASIPIEKESIFLKSLESGDNRIDVQKSRVIFNVDNYYTGMEKLFKLKNSIHMPIELKSCLEFIGPRVMQEVVRNESMAIVKVIINDKFNLNDDESKNWMEFSEQPLTITGYFSGMVTIITTMENWLQTNSRTKIRFNL